MTLSQIYARVRKGRTGRFVVLKAGETLQEGDIQISLCGVWEVREFKTTGRVEPHEAIIRLEFDK